jgi:hypothetical protein
MGSDQTFQRFALLGQNDDRVGGLATSCSSSGLVLPQHSRFEPTFCLGEWARWGSTIPSYHPLRWPPVGRPERLAAHHRVKSPLTITEMRKGEKRASYPAIGIALLSPSLRLISLVFSASRLDPY